MGSGRWDGFGGCRPFPSPNSTAWGARGGGVARGMDAVLSPRERRERSGWGRGSGSSPPPPPQLPVPKLRGCRRRWGAGSGGASRRDREWGRRFPSAAPRWRRGAGGRPRGAPRRGPLPARCQRSPPPPPVRPSASGASVDGQRLEFVSQQTE